MIRFLPIVLISLLLSSCKSIELESKWRPLKRVTESPLQQKNLLTTLGSTVYVNCLEDWESNSKFIQEATLEHEKSHAITQRKIGLFKYLIKYSTDKEFRWKEEQLANYREIMFHKARAGFVIIDLDERAEFLSSKQYGYMISFEKAKVFLINVCNGTWEPKNE